MSIHLFEGSLMTRSPSIPIGSTVLIKQKKGYQMISLLLLCLCTKEIIQFLITGLCCCTFERACCIF